MPERPRPAPTPTDISPGILFEDTHVLVVDKPAGLLSQGEHRGDPNLVDWARTHLGRHYVGLIHRLDRNTSGVMVIGKRSKSAERLTAALQDGKIFRSYLGWIEGSLTEPRRWRHWLWKDQKENLTRVVSQSHPQGKEAVLSVTPLERGFWSGRPVTLAEFVLETGRSHQIRVQSAKERHPLLGDAKYGAQRIPDFPRPALHSHRIRFEHPMSREPMEFEAPLPADFLRVRSSAGGSSP